jgi:hypothetical protein
MLNDRRCFEMPAETFRDLFAAAARGEQNYFSAFVRPDPGRPSVDEWYGIRTAIFERDNYTCQQCGQHGGPLECDHIFPVSRGGLSIDANLQTLCRPCNRRKGAR